MSMSSYVIETRRAGLLTVLADYLELAKPRIATLVLVTVAVSAMLGAGEYPGGAILLHTLLGTALIATSASALNQWLERHSDARMVRTAERPLPAGRLAAVARRAVRRRHAAAGGGIFGGDGASG